MASCTSFYLQIHTLLWEVFRAYNKSNMKESSARETWVHLLCPLSSASAPKCNPSALLESQEILPAVFCDMGQPLSHQLLLLQCGSVTSVSGVRLDGMGWQLQGRERDPRRRYNRIFHHHAVDCDSHHLDQHMACG